MGRNYECLWKNLKVKCKTRENVILFLISNIFIIENLLNRLKRIISLNLFLYYWRGHYKLEMNLFVKNHCVHMKFIHCIVRVRRTKRMPIGRKEK